MEALNEKKNTYRDRFDAVVMSGKYHSSKEKIEALARMIHVSNAALDAEDCVCQALEELEMMTGKWYDPTVEGYNDLVHSVSRCF